MFTLLRLGCTSFGGPLAHIGYLREALVERRRWLSSERFLALVSLSQLLPGPASSQLGWAIGEQRGGWRGAVGAFVGFTLPSALLMYAAAVVAPELQAPGIVAVVRGLLVATVAVVGVAVVRMAQPIAADRVHVATILVSMTVMLVAASAWMQWVIIAMAAALGMVRASRAVGTATSGVVLTEPIARDGAAGELTAHTIRALTRRTTLLLAIFTVVLGAAVADTQLPSGAGADDARGVAVQDASLWSMAAAFVRAGAMVFGGGHVVLPLLDQELVRSGWMTTEQFLAGYGAAQLMPGPLFSVAAYFGAVINTGWPAWVNAVVALFALFLPGLLLMSAAAPWWTRAASHPGLRVASMSINAAVVGLLVAAWYDPIATHALRSPVDYIVAGIALLTLLRTRWSPVLVVVGCVALSVLLQ